MFPQRAYPSDICRSCGRNKGRIRIGSCKGRYLEALNFSKLGIIPIVRASVAVKGPVRQGLGSLPYLSLSVDTGRLTLSVSELCTATLGGIRSNFRGTFRGAFEAAIILSLLRLRGAGSYDPLM